jgi:hypothetical protein
VDTLGVTTVEARFRKMPSCQDLVSVPGGADKVLPTTALPITAVA